MLQEVSNSREFLQVFPESQLEQKSSSWNYEFLVQEMRNLGVYPVINISNRIDVVLVRVRDCTKDLSLLEKPTEPNPTTSHLSKSSASKGLTHLM